MTGDKIAALIPIEWVANPANSDDGFRLFRAVIRDRAWYYGTDVKGHPFWMAPHSAGKNAATTEKAACAAAEAHCRQTVLAEIEAVIPGLIPAARTLAAENERLREVLKPFAALADEVDRLRHPDDSTCIWRLSARSLRAARSALNPKD